MVHSTFTRIKFISGKLLNFNNCLYLHISCIFLQRPSKWRSLSFNLESWCTFESHQGKSPPKFNPLEIAQSQNSNLQLRSINLNYFFAFLALYHPQTLSVSKLSNPKIVFKKMPHLHVLHKSNLTLNLIKGLGSPQEGPRREGKGEI